VDRDIYKNVPAARFQIDIVAGLDVSDQLHIKCCGLDDVDPYAYEGTTGERFEQILGSADLLTQAMILRGVLEKYPVGSEGRTGVEVVEVGLKDAEVLLENGRPVSAVDRTHTAFHGLLKALCLKKGIAFDSGDSVTTLCKKLRRGASEFRPTGEYTESGRSVNVGVEIAQAASASMDAVIQGVQKTGEMVAALVL
jgi:hypothetical protein